MIPGESRNGTRLQKEESLKAFFAAMLVVLGSGAIADAQGVHEVEVHAEKVGEVVHWMPEKVEGVQGETVPFVFNHDLAAC